MKVTIKRSCGHEETVSVYGTGKERDSRIEWLKSTACKSCYKEEQLNSTSEHATNMNLPELTGSEKQVAWAMKIRNEKITEIVELFGLFTRLADGNEKKTEELNTIAKCVESIKQISDSKYWIDNRDVIGHDILKNAYKQALNK